MFHLRFSKTKVLLSLLFVCVILFSACSNKKEKESQKQSAAPRPKSVKSVFMDEYLESKWLNHLDEYEFGEIKETDDGFSYEFQTEKTDDSEVSKKVEYKKDKKGDFEGVMTVSFSKETDSYVMNVPKEFASHIDELDFSVKPSKVINPDPIIEFEDVKGKLSVKSKETKTKEEIDEALERQIIDGESKNCESLTGKKALECALSLISKYRDSEYIEEELKHENMGELLGASAQAVLQNDVRLCRHVNDKAQKELCYEYSYQTLVKDCDKKTGKEYRECVRRHSSNLPSMGEERLFCGHITDEKMRKECQGIAPLESCDEIGNQEDREKCQLNILRTKNDLRECSKLKDNLMKEACFAVIGADRADASVCKKIKDDYLKGQCLTKVAMTSGDKSLCSIIKDQQSKDLCNGIFIVKLEADKQMCAGTHDPFIRELCEMILAINEKDIEKCNKPEIIGFDNRFNCLAGIGMKHNDANVCGMIDVTVGEFEEDRKLREMTRDLCYMKVAINKKNAKLCDKIIDPKQKKACKEAIEKPEEEEEKKEETPTMSCADVGPATVCPMDNAKKNGATIQLQDNGRDVQCTYKSKKNGFRLHNEVYRNGKKRDGTYKEYDENGNIKKYSEYKDGRNDGFSLDCDSGGKLTRCWFYRPGQSNLNCME